MSRRAAHAAGALVHAGMASPPGSNQCWDVGRSRGTVAVWSAAAGAASRPTSRSRTTDAPGTRVINTAGHPARRPDRSPAIGSGTTPPRTARPALSARISLLTTSGSWSRRSGRSQRRRTSARPSASTRVRSEETPKFRERTARTLLVPVACTIQARPASSTNAGYDRSAGGPVDGRLSPGGRYRGSTRSRFHCRPTEHSHAESSSAGGSTKRLIGRWPPSWSLYSRWIVRRSRAAIASRSWR